MPGVWALDLGSGSLTQYQAHARDVVSIEPILDGAVFAIGHFSDETDIWSWESDSVLRSIPSCESYSNATRACGSYLASGCGAHKIEFWNITSASQPREIIERSYIAQNFSTAKEAGVFFAGSSDTSQVKREDSETCELVLYDVEGNRPIVAWRGHSNKGVRQTAIASNGEILASLGYDLWICVWRARGD